MYWFVPCLIPGRFRCSTAHSKAIHRSFQKHVSSRRSIEFSFANPRLKEPGRGGGEVHVVGCSLPNFWVFLMFNGSSES